MVQTSAKLAIYVNFKLNQEYIAKNLCIKKEIENNDCEGNCCLKESLEKQEKSENPTPNLPKEKSENLLFTGLYTWLKSSLLLISEQQLAYNSQTLVSHHPAIFHPPQSVYINLFSYLFIKLINMKLLVGVVLLMLAILVNYYIDITRILKKLNKKN